MVWLIAVPVWVMFWSFFRGDSFDRRINDKYYAVMCALAVIAVMGLRSRYSGTTDTYIYTSAFMGAKNFLTLEEYLDFQKVFDGVFLFSEAGFHTYTWLAARILPGTQWFLLVTSAPIVLATASFIARHSEDPVISWITFICLGSMTFAMNGMRQALAMSICLLSYRYVKEKKLLRFLLVVLLAVLFHKSAVIFLLVYPMRRMRLNVLSFAIMAAGIALFFAFGDRLAFFYDSMTGEDYATGESFESGGMVTILIYLIAIGGMLLLYKRLKEPENFLPFVLIVLAFSLYLGRFVSTQIYERISYYFSYFLMLCFPIALKDPDPRTRALLRTGFVAASIVLFAYRISKGVFSDFEMFWG